MTSLGRVGDVLNVSPGSNNVIIPPQPPRVVPRGLMTGLTARSWAQGTGGARNLIDSMVIDFYVKDAMPTRGVLDPGWVTTFRSQLDWCLSNTGTSGRSIPVSVRPRLGIWSPSHFFTLAGGMNWYAGASHDTDPAQPDPLNPAFFRIPQGTPIWWDHVGATVNYSVLAEEFFAAFAAEFATHAAIVEIDMGIACTQYVEPCIHQLGSQTNVNSLIAAGYSEALDVAAFVAGWGIFSRTWAPYRVAGFTSYNPPGAVNVAAGTGRQGGNMAKAISLMETQMAMLGGLTVLASESLSNLKPTDGGDYQTLYARQVLARNATPPTIIRYQTETYGNLAGKYALGASVQATIESAISLGATTAEIPVGCENPNPQPPPASPQPLMYVSPSAAAAYNTRFRANLIGLT